MTAKAIKAHSIPTRFSEGDLAAIKALSERLDVTDAWVIRHATQLYLKQCGAVTDGVVREELAPLPEIRSRARGAKKAPLSDSTNYTSQASQSSHSGKSASA